ncbi:TPA: hypothetical protein QFN59_002014 [Enterococcus faecium]|uniref:hypothetical protein n=1 Tax=Enterococcus sp. TaxID=35783 RepID=UPI0028416225|nr:hypothetical protein [Enterococcus sp.]MDR3761361.1 hypothetical protein [Enterococcus sp.]
MNELYSKITINDISFSITKTGNAIYFEVIPAKYRDSLIKITDENSKSTRNINYQDLRIAFFGGEEVEAFKQAINMLSTQLNQITGGN